MANKKNKPLFGGFDRLQSFPLDSSSVFETWGELEEYRLHSKIAYDGQLVVCLDTTLDHFGAYILQEKGGSTSYLHPYKLYGTEEFAKEVGELKNKLDALRNEFDTLSDEDVATLKTQMNSVNSWLNSIKDANNPDGGTIFATKVRLDEVNTNLNNRINELLGDEFTARLDDLENYRPTINRLWGFVQEYGPMIEQALYQHRDRILAAENLLIDHGTQLDALLYRLLSLQERISVTEAKYLKLMEHENRITSNEQAIHDINRSLESVEHVEEYSFGSLAAIGGVEYTPNMVIKEIEIVIDETGENVVGGIFSDNTRMYIDFPSTNNPQNSVDTVVANGEIFIAQGLKIVLDIDYEPQFNGHLRFCVENSEGLSGHAYVRYFERVTPEISKYSVTVSPLANMSIVGTGLYAENDQVTIELIPDMGYILKTDEHVAPQAIIAEQTYYVQEYNGRYTLAFTMLSRNINNICINGISAVKVPSSQYYDGVIFTADEDAYYSKLAIEGNSFEWLPVFIGENGEVNSYPEIEDSQVMIYLAGADSLTPNTLYYLNNAHVIFTRIYKDEEEGWVGPVTLAYTSILPEIEYLRLMNEEIVVEEESNGGE